MYDVYICYSTNDKETAGNVCKALEFNNLRCWIAPRDIRAGDNVFEQMYNAIRNSKCMVLILSQEAVNSNSIISEVDAAFSTGIPILIFNIDSTSCDGQLGFFIKGSPMIDASHLSEEDYLNLIDSVNELLYEGIHKQKILPTGIAKPEVLPEGMAKFGTQFKGKTSKAQNAYSLNPFIYLSYDKKDSQFIDNQISHYRSQGIDFAYKNIEKIKDSSLLVAFISKNSHKSSKIKDEVVKAISKNINILLVYLDDVEINFGRMFKLRYNSKFNHAVKFSIRKFEMNELSYIDRCSEIFELYGVKKTVTQIRQEEVLKSNSLEYLDDLIKSSGEIELSDSIDMAESSTGIEITADNLLIDGRNKKISISDVDYVFKVTSKNVVFRNITFTGCNMEDGSSIIKLGCDASLMLENCSFEMNRGCAISSSGSLLIKHSSIIGNDSKEAMISSKGRLSIDECKFSYNRCGAVFNEGHFEMKRTSFEDNDFQGNVIYNIGNLNFEMCRFDSNRCDENLIFNLKEAKLFEVHFTANCFDVMALNGGDFLLFECKFVENEIFKETLYNNGKFVLDRCILTDNFLKGGYEVYNEGNMEFKNIKVPFGKIFNAGHIFAQRALLGDIEGNDIDDMATGIAKPKVIIEGENKPYSYVYLSYDDADLDFITSQISQYEEKEISFTHGNDFNIIFSALVVVFISKDSCQSLKIRKDIKKAVSYDKRILMVYLDNVMGDFEDLLNDSIVYSINHYDISQLEYIDRYTDIFHLFGIKTNEMVPETSKPLQTPKTASKDAMSFDDLESLIKRDGEIRLTSDVCLVNDEKYENGIDLNHDGLTIKGCGHTITAQGIRKIFNIISGNVVMHDLNFKGCMLKDDSSIICVDENSSLTLRNCHFHSNDLDDGHVIFTKGNLKIEDSTFEANFSQNEGPAIFARSGNADIENTEFVENVSQNSGGAILNWAKMNISDSSFKQNSARGYGGAIGNVIDAVVNVKSTEFIENSAENDACAIYNENIASCSSCSFTSHTSDLSVIFNENTFDIFNCEFENNTSRLVIQNSENGVLYLSNSKFSENDVAITNVYNVGQQAFLDKVIFKANTSSNPKSVNIFNETYMRLKNPVSIDNAIFNTGAIDLWRYDPDLINNEGTVSQMDRPCEKVYNFTWLDEKIAQSDLVELENDIKLENCEFDFYEGGIEISKDNLIIDGCGHSIDGANRTSILRVTAKNVTLKNIIFKNANLINDFEKHTSGGSAIRTTTKSSLKVINCQFMDNSSDDDGGAILNFSKLHLMDCRFENNSSKTFAGAIYNRGTLFLSSVEFKGNSSRINQDILNAGKIKADTDNVYDIGIDDNVSEPFSFLADKIGQSNDIVLECDIRFDYKNDGDYKNGIDIIDVDSLTIDGAGFQMNGNGTASFFNLKNSRVTFKNIIFNNGYSIVSSIFESDGEIVFESCRFINNHATSDESLISNSNSVEIRNCQFINNVSKSKSLIVNNKNLLIAESQFELNSNENSIITNNMKLQIRDTQFLNNYSNENASAITNRKEGLLLVINTIFHSNYTSSSGGAIFNQGNLRIEGCDFESNHAKGDGSIINNEKDANLEIINSKVMENSSMGDGGAVINWGNLIFINTHFKANTARKDGGVVNVQRGSLKIERCIFDKNSAFDGAAIFNRGNLEIASSSFEKNVAKKDGGVLNSYDGEIEISKSLFKANSASDGGVIYSRVGPVHITNSEFKGNSAQINGGAIIKWCEMTIENSNLADNSAVIYGGAINNQKGLLTLDDSIFSDNKADTGGAVFNVDKNDLKIVGCKFANNLPDDVY